jgi:hypothetical protein
MDFANFGGSFPMVREHLTLFGSLLFTLPLTSFITIKLWIAARANKSQRKTNWFVPDNLESEAARLHYGMGHQSVAFARQVRRNSPHMVAGRNSRMRRRA